MTYQTARAEQATERCRLGATDQELADRFWHCLQRDRAELAHLDRVPRRVIAIS